MKELKDILEELCARVPWTIGAVCCDFDGETVVAALGGAEVPQAAAERAMEHVPRTLKLAMPVGEFLVRLAGAEPCALTRMFSEAALQNGGGAFQGYDVRFHGVEMLVQSLPEGYYLVLLLSRPAVQGLARRQLIFAADKLARFIE